MSDPSSAHRREVFDAVGHIETGGVDHVPLERRHSRPRELGIVFFGAQMCFGIIILGALPILFGLGWWGAFSAITIGTAVGSVLFGLMALTGPRTGTNSATSGGAFFGVIGRIIGSLIVLFIAIGFYALAVWTGAQVVVAVTHRLFGLPEGAVELATAYAVIGAITIAVALVGHATVAAAQNVIAPVVALLLIVGVCIKLPNFHQDYAGGDLLLSGFWPTWLLAAVTASSLPLSYAPFVNDYARYLPARQARRGSWSAGLGIFLGCWLALLFAAYFTSLFPDRSVDFIFGLINVSPTWFAIPLALVGLIGACGQGAIALYGSGLDTSALIPRLGRIRTTVLISLIGLALVYLGSLVWDAITLVSAFTTLLTVLTAPWLVVIVMGHFAVRGRYVVGDLQMSTGGGKGGAYWYTRGWNLYALGAWVPAVIVGLLLSNTPPLLEGPLRNIAGGVDLSFPASAGLAILIYGGFIVLLPHRALPGPANSPASVAVPLPPPSPAPSSTAR
jgi:purine-cytosine permease-like protein